MVDDRTVTRVKALEGEERELELARMLAGDEMDLDVVGAGCQLAGDAQRCDRRAAGVIQADAVAGLLASRGLPMASIETTARGEEAPRVPTADGVRE